MAKNFPEIEEQILEFWERNKIFEKSLEKLAQRGEFIFYDGPPFATGFPHYGHILASTIKDVIPRYKTMRGYHVRRRWGWDCHGLPIENIVEKQLDISGKKQIEEKGIEFFNRACREGVLKYASEWGKMVRRIARFVEFENSYKTMDNAYMESVWWALKQIWEKKLIYEGRKVLLYCPRCETPISNFEVAMDNSYEDVSEEAVTVKFKVHNVPRPPLNLRGGEGELPTYFLVWTTTPWTLPGNMALTVGEDIDYVLVRMGGEQYVVAKARLSILGEGYEIVQEIKGRDLVGLGYEPLFVVFMPKSKKAFKVYAADFVTPEDGTGIVHTAVVYGEDDYNLGLKVGLPIVPLLDEKGIFNEQAPELIRGKYFKDSEMLVKGDLEKRGLLFKREMYTHSYPFCWRCSTQLFYNAIPAWFIKIQKIKKNLLKLNEKINWYPEHLKHGRFEKGIESAPDWNISRNRYWATPLPFWRCVGSNAPLPAQAGQPPLKLRGGEGGVMGCGKVVCVGSFEELKQRATNYDEVYKSRELKDIDLHRPYIDGIKLRCEECGGEMQRIPEVIDCWVESASMPFAELHYPFENQELFKERYPADFVAEYIAQTRAWFYVMHVVGSILFGKPPFRNIVTTGTILNEKGEKLSKSKQNYPDPWDIIRRYGVDSLRFYLMISTVMQADNLFFSEREVDGIYKKVVLLTLNVLSFYKLYEPKESNAPLPVQAGQPPLKLRGGAGGVIPPISRNVLDKWIIARLHETIRDMTAVMDSYDVVRAGRLLPVFIDDLSTWYLRRSRERLKSEKKREREAALNTLRYVLLELAKLLAPFMPFLAEHIWQSTQHVIVSDLPAQTGAKQAPEIASSSAATRSDIVNSVHLQDWPKVKKAKIDAALLEEMRLARKAVELVHAIRAQEKIRVRQPLSDLEVSGAKLSPEMLRIVLEEVNVKHGHVFEDQLKPKDNYRMSVESGLSVNLGVKISEELQKEGLLREIGRHMNEMRKIARLTPSDHVEVMVATADSMLRQVIKEFQKQLRKAVIAQSVLLVDTRAEMEWSHEVELENHEKAWIGMRKV